MKYLNGKLRTEQDTTLWLRPDLRKGKLTWAEYIPLVVLGIMMAGLLLRAIFG